MALKSFKTFNGLTIEWDDSGGWQIVTIMGDRKKTLYEGRDTVEAAAEYNYAVQHYKDRDKAAKEDKTKGDCDVLDCPVGARKHPSHREGDVRYVAKGMRS